MGYEQELNKGHPAKLYKCCIQYFYRLFKIMQLKTSFFKYIFKFKSLEHENILMDFISFGEFGLSNNFYKLLKIFPHFYNFFTNAQPGSKLKFGRALKLILMGNRTSI